MTTQQPTPQAQEVPRIPTADATEVPHAELTQDERAFFGSDLLAALRQIERLGREGAVSAQVQYSLVDIARAAIVKAEASNAFFGSFFVETEVMS